MMTEKTFDVEFRHFNGTTHRARVTGESEQSVRDILTRERYTPLSVTEMYRAGTCRHCDDVDVWIPVDADASEDHGHELLCDFRAQRGDQRK